MTEAETVLVATRGRVATLTINRPRARNAFSSVEQIDAFVAALERIGRDDAISVLIVTGAGSAFCAGGDIKDMQAGTGLTAGSAVDLRQRYRRDVQRLTSVLYGLEIPTIAAVNGPAMGLGCDLACCCDMRIAAESARFAESFVRLGLVAGDGGAWFLQRIVGISRASELSFTGDVIDAREAERIGLVSQVVAADDLETAAAALADRIAANPPQGLRLTKRLLREAQRAPLETLFELSAALQALTQKTADHREALGALVEGRTGEYTGQ
jgi:enoyl-CoA hydratase/carnithine racemase